MSERIDRPGVYELSEEAYHADPCPEPSLSAHVAIKLIDRSARHAQHDHPRLNDAFEATHADRFDVGKAAHAMMLGSEAAFEVIEADSWRGKEAKRLRDEARKVGKIPLLAWQFEQIEAMARAGKEQLAEYEDETVRLAFSHGRPEQTLVWREGDVWCRSRLDWLKVPADRVVDYKSTPGSANPEVWANRQLFSLGLDIQSAFYRRGLRKLKLAYDPDFVFVVQESNPPYALSVVGLSPAAVDLAESRVEGAVQKWRECLRRSKWPGYARNIFLAEPPIWLQKRELDRVYAQQFEREVDPVEALGAGE